MNNEEVENVLPLFEGAVETGRIKRKSLKNWLVKVYFERRSLVHSLNDTKTAVDDLNTLASVIVLIVIIIVWLLIMGFLTTQVLVFISSQLLLVVFMFGNTAKTVFEAIIFVFVMHPYDVGDRCVIDGVQMIVEEMNILTTVFLRYDNEKIFYPNSVLATKPISNFYRSPEMSDSVEFVVDVSTSIESIGALKAKLKAYLESKPQYWRPYHSVLVKDIENVNQMKMGLSVTHTINFQNHGDKSSRRSELVLELKKILEDLNIKYHLLPQEVHLSYVRSED
ncbi:Mechanosensitive ion channel protein 10 [Spatholobus suberectus]|nr:Mechanosensitive ion channel protein 10 [Spatholobus suberectus]